MADRFDGFTPDFMSLIQSWDKIKFGTHPPQFVPIVVMSAAHDALKDATKPLLDQKVMAETTKCVEILAPKPLFSTNLDEFRDCLRAATR